MRTAILVSEVAPDSQDGPPSKKSRVEERRSLFVRSLPSTATNESVADFFSQHYPVKHATVVVDPKTKESRGYGFVTFTDADDAVEAKAKLNNELFGGRRLRLEVAEPRHRAGGPGVVKSRIAEEKKKREDDLTEARKAPKLIIRNLPWSIKSSDQLSKNFSKYGKIKFSDLPNEKGKLKGFGFITFRSKKHAERAMIEMNGKDIDGRTIAVDWAVSKEEWQQKNPKRTTDNSTTIFIRNLPFTATNESVKEHFEKFGPVRYARIVMDKMTERPAGTGFVCFVKDDDFKACLKSAPRPRLPVKTAKTSVLQDESVDTDGRYTLDGRVLSVAHAVSKEEAGRLAEAGPAARKTEDKDKRRLFLLSEGTIPTNSPLYGLLTPTEIKLREQSAQQRKKQVQGNPSLHISLTRLAIRNMPRNMDSKEFKQLARQAVVGFASDVREGKRQALSKEELARGGAEDREAEHRRKEKGVGVVKQAKIVYETKDGKKVDEKSGAGKSRGYGFIEYSSHRWALMGLRWLNGHPLKNEAGRTVRLIVEFAIENAQVTSRRRANEHRARQKRSEIAQNGGNPADKRGNKPVTGNKGQAKVEKVEVETEEESSKKKDAKEKLAQRQRIIGRKRMVRKNKKAGR
ncbi:Nucleolar protein 4 [Cytospora mali]|uniref:Nucleolar protein 4 n=1 Tax=Cytospora mali TaxID=578113 RepID=A0A194V5E1_CYTMA|nr:Nucleolar protein 4 [Valsa mali var. pyri (nom. inval.)]